MDWRIFFSTFALVFLAELGDKTQLATLALAARSRSPLLVFGGAALALVSTTLLSVLLSEVLCRVIPVEYLNRGAGLIFIVIGAIILFNK
jgi:Ca2+/H+ antiporter, TMEM165/GDT1 family